MDIGEIILYQPDASLKIEVCLNNETVWLNRQQMAVLFNRDIKTIGKHINNALAEELNTSEGVARFATSNFVPQQVVAKFATTAFDTVYHIGTSLKDLGRRWFAFSKMEMPASELINKTT